MKDKSLLLLAFIFIVSLAARLFYVSNFNFAFTIDQARDMLEIRKIVVAHDPVFIGPITSLNGVFLGPFWFYYNLPAFLISGGSPAGLAFFSILAFHFIILIFYLYFRKNNPPFAFWASLLLLLSPRLFEATSYSFNANTTPLFILLSLVGLDFALSQKSRLSGITLGLLVGLALQFEAAFGILLFPLALYWLIKSKTSTIRYFLLGFGLTLLPQLMFEIKHNFLMTKTFITEFSGGSDILGQRLTLTARLADRWRHYWGVLSSSLPLFGLTPYLFILALVYLLFFKRSRFFLINLSLIVLSLVLYFIYPARLKDWWTINLSIPYILITALALSRLPKYLFLIILLGVFPFYLHRYQLRLAGRSNDRALLLNQIEAVDWIYRQAAGTGFTAYVFTPAIYDYNYQYLFWWHGLKRYGYLPEKLTYENDAPPYIENNQIYWQKTKPSQNLTFLIIESDPNRPDRESAWRDGFAHLCQQKKETLTGDIIMEKLTPCQP